MKKGEASSSLMSEAVVASRAGTWEYDVVAGLFFLDPVASRLCGFDPEDGRRGLQHVVFLGSINPVDRARGTDNMKRLLRDGGVFVFEHRVNPEPSVERWLLARGLYEKDADGVVRRGRGIVFDITKCRADGYVTGDANFTRPSSPPRPPMPVAGNGQDEGGRDHGTALTLETGPRLETVPILAMTEHLIAAHRIAKTQNDEATLVVISTAMFHLGRRLKDEVESRVGPG